MTKRMLIDATHPEETRAVVLDGNHLVDFDFETSTKRQLKGNVYLAKVTRVEPSLQAAFVEYGGNRHGFLAFSEIHPDYYQIPQADRAVLEEVEREAAEKIAAAADGEAATASAASASAASAANGSGEHPAANGEAPTTVGGDSADSEADEERAALLDEQARRARGCCAPTRSRRWSSAGRSCWCRS
jgi:ribonuclease E